MKKIFFIILIGFLLHSCATKSIMGQYVSPKDISLIQEKKYNKEQVSDLLAAPSFVSERDSNVWYYISRNMKIYPFSKPKLEKQQIVKITFHNKGTFKSIQVDEVYAQKYSNFDQNSNPTYGTRESLLQHWLSNFGKFGHKNEHKKR